jgi:3-oxoacyl-(acyl-carrier-protein) synthase
VNATSRRVVVTGLGIVSPLGVGLRDNFDALLESRTGIRQITSFDASRFPTRVAGEMPAFDVRSFATGSESLRGVESSRKSLYSYAAAAMALGRSRLVFGAHGAKLPVSSTKSPTGHMVAAAGAMEAAICVLGLRNGLVFATATLRESDPQCDLDLARRRRAGLRR